MIVDSYIKKSDFPRHVQFDSAQPRMIFSREYRDLQFKKLMLSSHVDRLRMDEVDRDVLYIALRDYPIERVVKKYDQIPPEVLRYAKNNFNP
ncbi:MAG: hypothetical protein H7235_01370 [Bdellovibrionaceae bacterium]|nr:hypothetical protein [Pseudobdellovibrionaceae bacterium]